MFGLAVCEIVNFMGLCSYMLFALFGYVLVGRLTIVIDIARLMGGTGVILLSYLMLMSLSNYNRRQRRICVGNPAVKADCGVGCVGRSKLPGSRIIRTRMSGHLRLIGSRVSACQGSSRLDRFGADRRLAPFAISGSATAIVGRTVHLGGIALNTLSVAIKPLMGL